MLSGLLQHVAGIIQIIILRTNAFDTILRYSTLHGSKFYMYGNYNIQ